MKIAIAGCAHGELDKIYESIQALENKHGIKIDLLIICGDFQSVRNPSDLESMAVPPKNRKLNTFYKYYSGEEKAPVLTIFVGVNYEASNYLSELSYGGWVCPNIYYMGYANVINIGGLRIAGLSGIYKNYNYLKGHFETPPYNSLTVKSVYHVRNVDVFKLKQVKKPIDICISHDWPRCVYRHGNLKRLLRYKPYLRYCMKSDNLGSLPGEELLMKLKPSYWFAAHLHCKYSALVPHENKERPFTKFLALDKCSPNRRFLQVLEIGKGLDSPQIEYDPEWLGILFNTNHLLNVSMTYSYIPAIGGPKRWDFSPNKEELDYVRDLLNDNMKVPCNFVMTAPTFLLNGGSSSKSNSMKKYINPQTQTFCKLLNLTDPHQAVSLNDSYTTSDFSGTHLDTSIATSIKREKISESSSDKETEGNSLQETDLDTFIKCEKISDSSSDEETEGNSQKDDDSEFLDFFTDRVGSLGKKNKQTLSRNQSEIPTKLTNINLCTEIKTEDTSSKSRNFLKDEPDNSDIQVQEVEKEIFPEIITENLKDDAASPE